MSPWKKDAGMHPFHQLCICQKIERKKLHHPLENITTTRRKNNPLPTNSILYAGKLIQNSHQFQPFMPLPDS